MLFEKWVGSFIGCLDTRMGDIIEQGGWHGQKTNVVMRSAVIPRMDTWCVDGNMIKRNIHVCAVIGIISIA